MSRALELIQEIESIGGEIWVEGTDLLIRPEDAAEPVLEELVFYKPEIIALLQNRTAVPTDDDLLDGEWLLEECAYRDRCWGGIGALYVSLSRWLAERGKPVPASRLAFADSLLREGFVVSADGLVANLTLKADLIAHEQFQRGRQ